MQFHAVHARDTNLCRIGVSFNAAILVWRWGGMGWEEKGEGGKEREQKGRGKVVLTHSPGNVCQVVKRMLTLGKFSNPLHNKTLSFKSG